MDSQERILGNSSSAGQIAITPRMKYIDEFRDRKLIAKLSDRIREAVESSRAYRFMEVCGTHTMAVFRFGLRELLPDRICLISGPGCPVCVTPNVYLDTALALSDRDDITIATFGDMMRVPGSRSSLEAAKSRGASIRPVYSTDDALDIARRDPDRQVVFLGIGFETTAPTVAASIIEAKREGIKNYSVLCGHKTMPEAMGALLKDRDIEVDGFLLPGHVSAVIGTGPYKFLASRHRMRCVVAGFEPIDIMQSILMLVRQSSPSVQVQYSRVIGRAGNVIARRLMDKVFEKTDSDWRGIGTVAGSGLRIRRAFSSFDAEARFRVRVPAPKEPKGCLCGDVLKGLKQPPDCPLFAKVCNPLHPIGACMVSVEGTCAAYYKYQTK